MSIGVNRHKILCTVRDVRLSKCSIIIIIIITLVVFGSGNGMIVRCLEPMHNVTIHVSDAGRYIGQVIIDTSV